MTDHFTDFMICSGLCLFFVFLPSVINDFGQVCLFVISWNFSSTLTLRVEKVLPVCSYKHSK